MKNILFSTPPEKPTSTDPCAPARTRLTQPQIDAAVRACLSLQQTAVDLHSKRPFAALLLGPDNTSVLLTHYSISHVQHAETELARLASIHFSQEYLWACTLVSTWEPCAMCTGTLYWSNIGRLLYAASEEELNKLTGSGNGENMTMNLACRDVLKAGQKDVEVIGPLGVDQGGWERKVVEESANWWRHNRKNEDEARRMAEESSLNGNEYRDSTQNEEGNYDAKLDIDWLR